MSMWCISNSASPSLALGTNTVQQNQRETTTSACIFTHRDTGQSKKNQQKKEEDGDDTETTMEEFDEEEQTPAFPSSLLLNLYLGHFLARWGARSFSIFFILHHLSRFFTGLFYFYLGFFNCLLFISFNEAEFGDLGVIICA